MPGTLSHTLRKIKILNAFHDRVGDIKTVEEITMKKDKMVDDLLAVANVCIMASEARAQLPESRNKGPSKKKLQEDWEVNTTNHRDRDNRGNR
jgi:hypothetical protein